MCRTAIFALLLASLLLACTKEPEHHTVEFRAICGQCTVQYGTSQGDTGSATVDTTHSFFTVMEEGAAYTFSGCSQEYPFNVGQDTAMLLGVWVDGTASGSYLLNFADSCGSLSGVVEER